MTDEKNKVPGWLQKPCEDFLRLEYSTFGASSKPFRDGFELCFELMSRPENLAKLGHIKALLWAVQPFQEGRSDE